MWERWGDVRGRKGLGLKLSQVKQVLPLTVRKALTLPVPPLPGHEAGMSTSDICTQAVEPFGLLG